MAVPTNRAIGGERYEPNSVDWLAAFAGDYRGRAVDLAVKSNPVSEGIHRSDADRTWSANENGEADGDRGTGDSSYSYSSIASSPAHAD